MNRVTIIIAALTVALSACGGGASDTISFKGTIAGADGTGVLELKFPKSASSFASASGATGDAATGTITFTGKSAISITGTFNTADGTFTLTGSNFSVSGTLNKGVASGTVTGPNGMNAYTIKNATGGNIKIYCGTYMDSTQNGYFNVVVDFTTNTLAGTSWSTTRNSGGAFTGTVSNNMVTIDAVGATGTISGDSISGTYPANGTRPAGTWSGSVGACN